MTGRLLLQGAVLLDPESTEPRSGSMLLENGRIEAIFEVGSPLPGDCGRVDLKGRQLAPGFLDLHYHGNLIFLEADAYEAALAASSASLLRHGTTGFLPTTLAWGQSELLERVGVLSEIVALADPLGAAPLGLHLEGPWIRAEAAGAQPAQAIRAPVRHEVAAVLERGGGKIRMVTFAPELDGADELQAELVKRGVIGALGHSHAQTQQVDEAVERGASHVTHLFNAMGPLHHRAPGLAGAALADDRLTCDLICDGAHVHPTAVRAAARALADRLVLISDRIEAPGSGGARTESGTPESVTPTFGSGCVADDGVAVRFADGSLAGSSVTLDLALRNLRAFANTSLLDAVKACTVRPARVLGIEAERGTLRPGARADFAVLDAEGRVLETWVAGHRHFSAAD